MNVFLIAAVAFAGGIVSALLGWLDSGESFNNKKFSASILRALIAGVVFGVGYTYANSLSAIDIGVAFLGGAGVDVLGNRVSGVIKAGLK